MNRSYMNDEDTLEEMNSIKNSSIEEILHPEYEELSLKSSEYIPTKIDQLELERDFIAVTEGLMNRSPFESMEESFKKAIIQMREYYSDSQFPCEPEVDAWLKEQETKYNIGSCYEPDEEYRNQRLDDFYDHDLDKFDDYEPDYETELSDRHFADHSEASMLDMMDAEYDPSMDFHLEA